MPANILNLSVYTVTDVQENDLEEWLREHPRKGLPAPWVSEQWKDDDYALKIICGPEGRLSIEQVIAIRTMATGGVPTKEIAAAIGAKNEDQVHRVIQGKTYQRVNS